ncbi:MAG: hypothetical protein Q8736_02775, partial [Sweet potato little leaf phytoplasma]|nr:hypothetical protein [Sweet potato little leaf phytoplasma]
MAPGAPAMVQGKAQGADDARQSREARQDGAQHGAHMEDAPHQGAMQGNKAQIGAPSGTNKPNDGKNPAGTESQIGLANAWANFDISKLRNVGEKLDFYEPELKEGVEVIKLVEEDVA